MTFDDAVDEIMILSDDLGTKAHERFFDFEPGTNLACYWQGQADAYTDVIEHCEIMKERHGPVAGYLRRVLRSTRVRLGL